MEALENANPNLRTQRQERTAVQRIAQAPILIGLIAGAILAIHFDLGSGATGVVGAAFALPGVVVSEKVGKPVRVGKYDDASVEFRFKSAEYANQFRALNQQA